LDVVLVFTSPRLTPGFRISFAFRNDRKAVRQNTDAFWRREAEKPEKETAKEAITAETLFCFFLTVRFFLILAMLRPLGGREHLLFGFRMGDYFVESL
jgi:hypothetical protein